jgi:hypothetical protein
VLAAVAPRDQHVGRLDVAVHEPVRVRHVERAGDLGDQRDGALGLERPAARQQRTEVGSLDVAHRHVQDAVLLAGVEDLDGVRMVDRRRGAALVLEAGAEHRILRGVGRDQLEGDRPLQREIGRAEHDAHAAAPRHRVDAMPREDRSYCRRARHPSPIRACQVPERKSGVDDRSRSCCGSHGEISLAERAFARSPARGDAADCAWLSRARSSRSWTRSRFAISQVDKHEALATRRLLEHMGADRRGRRRRARASPGRRGLDTVILSGGVFQNRVLLERTTARLDAAGLRVLVPRRLPANDGGIAFGQAAVAAARTER